MHWKTLKIYKAFEAAVIADYEAQSAGTRTGAAVSESAMAAAPRHDHGAVELHVDRTGHMLARQIPRS